MAMSTKVDSFFKEIAEFVSWEASGIRNFLNTLHADCAGYWHGHSVGGTNPSLLRAAGAGAAIFAYDNIFNREGYMPTGVTSAEKVDVKRLMEDSERNVRHHQHRAARTREDVIARYDWSKVAESYLELCGALSRRRNATSAHNGHIIN